MKRLTLLALVVAPLAAPFALAPAHAMPAAAFLRTAAQTDNAEITVGNLAASRGGTAGARAFGRRLASDHSAHLAQVQALAARMRIAIPGGVTPSDRALAARLRVLRGPLFDRTFSRAMVDGHQRAIAVFQAQARTGDRMTAGLARDTLPALREHLRMAQMLR